MQDHTVTIDGPGDPPAIQTSDIFNVAVPFIDRHLTEGRGEKTAISTAHENVTYSQLAERVNRWGNALKGLGVKPAERVLMVVRDCPEFFYLFFGAIKAGVIPAPVNTMLRAPDYKFMIEDSGCKALIYTPELAEVVEGGLGLADHQPAIILKATGPGSIAEPMAQASTDLEPAPTRLEDDCFWLYSSGSTGNPKGVVHAHRAMLYTGQCAGMDTLGVQEDDVCFSASKLFHSYGFGNALTFPLWVGCTAFLSDEVVNPAMSFDVIERFKPTYFFGVPTLYAQQLEYLEGNEVDISSLRVCASAGEALPGDIFRRWQEKTGTQILEIYGSTEILHAVIGNSAARHNPGSSGQVVGRYEVKIIGDDGEEAPQGELGAVHVRGGSAAKYYWNDEEKTEATMLANGWLNMGDNSYLAEDGWYFYGGRRDDMMKVGGLWCSPFEIEARLIEHPKILEAAVVGRADPDQLLKPEAFIILAEGAEAGPETEEELLAHCRDGLSHYKYPRWFNFVTELPKTATGKIQRFKLRQ